MKKMPKGTAIKIPKYIGMKKDYTQTQYKNDMYENIKRA